MVVSAFATWPVPVRSPSCSMMGFACRKSFVPSAKSGNGFLMSDWLRSGFMPVRSATFRSSNLVVARTNTVSSC